ncbi:MAG TPA: hypothetical protein VLX68_17400 [Chitinivibrionales bacterium]|nr:hypothetical protein [Chitinivibrionales bacterium]
MKKLLAPLLLCAALLVYDGCTSEGLSDRLFGIAGITFDAKDSTVLKGTSVTLTDFWGHLKNPVPDVNTVSDSTGHFYIKVDIGIYVIKNLWGTTTYEADSCRVIFSKPGYRNDSMVLRGASNSLDTAGRNPPDSIYL